ncbi:MAG: DsrE family protein [Candidatus Methylomirabilales bacterium]
MAKILFIVTHATDDPTRAVLPFVAAKGARDAGHEASIDLSGEAVWLMRDIVAENAKGVGWPTVKELLATVVAAGVRIHV